MRNKRTMAQRLRDINEASKRAGARHDLTMDQWQATLEYFDHRCAYCGGPFEIFEHYLANAGTTVSNCVPACSSCNVMKDKHGHDLSFYQNENVLRFIETQGVKINFHIHKFAARQEEYVILFCEICGLHLTALGLSIADSQEYIEQSLANTGYAYIE